MNMQYRRISFLAFLFIFRLSCSQSLPTDVCKIKNGNLEFTIDLNWTDKQKLEFQHRYDIDSMLIVEMFKGKTEFIIHGEKWKVEPINNNIILLHKPVQKKTFLSSVFFRILDHLVSSNKGMDAKDQAVNFGINGFIDTSLTRVSEDKIRFSLKEHACANQVFLSGSFNNWSTSDLKMTKQNGKWFLELDLMPGKYLYKFIVDGRWIPDPNNLQVEDDGVRGKNSVVFVTNHRFVLNEFPNAERVTVAGDFNNWDFEEAYLAKNKKSWILDAFVKYGKYQYQFMVDGKRISDPENKEPTSSKSEHSSSQLKIGEGYEFYLEGFTYANKVFVAGTFNNWKPNNIAMDKTETGWKCTCYIAPGNYEYKFIVDGKWMPDPKNLNSIGTGEFTNSFFVYKPNYTFTLKGYEKAENVIVTGTFNNWIHHGYKMEKQDGLWKIDLYLQTGKHNYKFIVDGNWIHDPQKTKNEINKFNSFDSVIWIENKSNTKNATKR